MLQLLKTKSLLCSFLNAWKVRGAPPKICYQLCLYGSTVCGGNKADLRFRHIKLSLTYDFPGYYTKNSGGNVAFKTTPTLPQPVTLLWQVKYLLPHQKATEQYLLSFLRCERYKGTTASILLYRLVMWNDKYSNLVPCTVTNRTKKRGLTAHFLKDIFNHRWMHWLFPSVFTPGYQQEKGEGEWMMTGCNSISR